MSSPLAIGVLAAVPAEAWVTSAEVHAAFMAAGGIGEPGTVRDHLRRLAATGAIRKRAGGWNPFGQRLNLFRRAEVGKVLR